MSDGERPRRPKQAVDDARDLFIGLGLFDNGFIVGILSRSASRKLFLLELFLLHHVGFLCLSSLLFERLGLCTSCIDLHWGLT